IFWVFPVDSFAVESMVSDATMISGEPLKRLGGLAIAGQAICCGICAVIGLRGLLTARGFGYGILVLAAFVLSLFAGFRTNVVYLAVLFCLLFWLEGLARTRWLPILAGIIIVAFLAVLPIVDRLPLSFQRSLSFLPVNISPVVAADARASTEWRLAIWRQMWPEVPRYLWLGKGFTFNGRDLEFAELKQQLGNGEQGEVSRLSGDYHSGPLSLLIPFGLPGMLSFIWLLLAGLRALHRNRIYGDAGLRTINNFLFTIFLLRAFFYFVVYGSLYTDLPVLLGVLGLSISLNGGICSPQKKLASQPPTTFRPRIS
ncbi:MAG: O-Antigen ligase, partial [Verrucomicrobiota bacterium]